MRRLLTILTGAVMCLAIAPVTTPAAHAVDPPVLVGFEYINGPYLWNDAQAQPIARVVLDAPAQGDTVVAVSSSDHLVAHPVPDWVTVASGSTTAIVLVDALDVGITTLTATLGATSVSATPALEVRSTLTPTFLSALSFSPDEVAPGGTADAIVVLDFLAPPGGLTVTIGSTHPELGIPAEVVVPEGQYQSRFTISVPSDHVGNIGLTATLGAVMREATLTVIDPDPDDDGVLGPSDRCPEIAGPSSDGCPTVGAEVTLAYRSAAKKFRGTVTTGSGCATARKVTLYRVRTGADARVDSATTNDTGVFVIARDARAGRYYAKATPKDVEGARCLASTSPSIRVR